MNQIVTRNLLAAHGTGRGATLRSHGDEAHVEKNRELYVAKFDLADQIIGDRYGYKRPAGGFFLWIDVSAKGTDEEVAVKLWREGGLRDRRGVRLRGAARLRPRRRSA